MRKLFIAILALAMVTGVAGAVPLTPVTSAGGDAVFMEPGVAGVISSDNVEYHGTIPLDSPGVGGELVEHEDGNRYFYVTGGKGLSIYDVSDPAFPQHVSTMPFPHFQNEDLKVSDDGTRAMIAADGSLLVPVTPHATGIHVVDTSDVTNPQVIASSSELIRGDGTGLGVSEHTAECAVADCSVIYGRSGRIYVVDEAEGTVTHDGDTGFWNGYVDPETGNEVSAGGIHALNRDETGLVISDSHPRLVLDVSNDPLNPEVLAIGFRDQLIDGKLQHNNVRVDAGDWTERDPEDPADAVEVATVDRSDAPANLFSAVDQRPVMRAGELMLGNSETNLNSGCGAAGGLSTWSMVNFDQGAQMQQLEVFRPLNGNWADGSPPRNGLGCSGHWFTVNDDIVAASWYEHGVRFFHVDKEVGTLTELGWFQPLATEAGAAYWVDEEFVYSVDYARGIDIVRFLPDAEAPSQEESDRSWLANANRVGTFAQAERLNCVLSFSDE